MPGFGLFKALFNALFASIAGAFIGTIRTEYRIAKVEIKVKLRELRSGTIMLVVASVFAFFMIGLLLTAATLGLAEIMPAWAAALVVGGALMLWVLVFGIWGIVKVRANSDLVPHESLQKIKDSSPF